MSWTPGYPTSDGLYAVRNQSDSPHDIIPVLVVCFNGLMFCVTACVVEPNMGLVSRVNTLDAGRPVEHASVEPRK